MIPHPHHILSTSHGTRSHLLPRCGVAVLLNLPHEYCNPSPDYHGLCLMARLSNNVPLESCRSATISSTSNSFPCPSPFEPLSCEACESIVPRKFCESLKQACSYLFDTTTRCVSEIGVRKSGLCYLSPAYLFKVPLCLLPTSWFWICFILLALLTAYQV